MPNDASPDAPVPVPAADDLAASAPAPIRNGSPEQPEQPPATVPDPGAGAGEVPSAQTAGNPRPLPPSGWAARRTPSATTTGRLRKA